MHIAICSSIDFTPKIKECMEYLESNGHTVDIPFMSEKIIRGDISMDEFLKVKEKEGDIGYRKNSGINHITRHYNLIKECDAVLIINIEKKGIPGYIGGNTFLEMGFAHVLGKKIFVLNPLPIMPYSDELQEMNLTVIDNDLDLLFS